MTKIDNWYLDNLVCPLDKTNLTYSDRENILTSETGNIYPVIQGIPVMLVKNVEQTIELAKFSLTSRDNEDDPYFINTLGITDQEKEELKQYIRSKKDIDDFEIDPIVQFLVGATNGILYKDCIANLHKYPMPELRLSEAKTSPMQLLDIGCSWGRWCISGSKKNYRCIGLDPSLGAILAGKRIAEKLGINIKFVVGDARYLPFRDCLFDRVFSYSVIQHFSKIDAKQTFQEIERVLQDNGSSLIQMPNRWGIRSLQHQIKRGFKEGENFDVRYWGIKELHDCFNETIGKSEISIDGFFGLGIQKSDIDLLPKKYQIIIKLSESLRSFEQQFPFLKYLADSIYIKSIKKS